MHPRQFLQMVEWVGNSSDAEFDKGPDDYWPFNLFTGLSALICVPVIFIRLAFIKLAQKNANLSWKLRKPILEED